MSSKLCGEITYPFPGMIYIILASGITIFIHQALFIQSFLFLNYRIQNEILKKYLSYHVDSQFPHINAWYTSIFSSIRFELVIHAEFAVNEFLWEWHPLTNTVYSINMHMALLCCDHILNPCGFMRESMDVPHNPMKYNWLDIMICNMSVCWRKSVDERPWSLGIKCH